MGAYDPDSFDNSINYSLEPGKYIYIQDDFIYAKLFISLFTLSLIDWCLTPTLAVFQLYHGVNKFYLLTWLRVPTEF